MTLLCGAAIVGCGQRSSEQVGTPARVVAAAPSPEVAMEAPPPPPPPPVDVVEIRVLSAELAGRMANGEHWDREDAEAGAGVPKALRRYVELHPELTGYTDWIGLPVDDDRFAEEVSESPAADPMVVVELDGAVARSQVVARSFTPVWDFSFRFLYGQLGARVGVPRGSLARIHVLDYDGPGAVDAAGTTVIPVDELLAKPVHELGPFGSVKKLLVEVRTLDPPEAEDAAVEKRLAVPGTVPWTDTGIDLEAGQRVVIRAADEVCTGPETPYCSGPEGQREPDTRNNLPGFLALGHGALVAAVGDTRFAIQREQRFVAPASGRLRLGVNDTDVENNHGAYAVHIVIYELP
ncbi:C2 domain-containing protein [Haliangium sp.]|uniref:C2 domain-containing protein n=1 Tax=Haliangium sp. TaxID=2663208 RepID=UPI003D0DCC30